METKRPDKTFKAGSVQAAIWSNTADHGEFKTVQLTRSYKDRGGSWKQSSSLRAADLPRASLVLNKAYEYLTMESSEA